MADSIPPSEKAVTKADPSPSTVISAKAKTISSIAPAPQELWNRIWIILSFWAVVLFLGIPLWILTTSVYRAPLPLPEMTAWSEGKMCKIDYPLRVGMAAAGVGFAWAGEAGRLVHDVQLKLDGGRNERNGGGQLKVELVEDQRKGEGEKGKCTLLKEEVGEERLAAMVRLLPGKPGSTMHTHALHPESRDIDLFYASTYDPNTPDSLSELSTYVTTMLQEVFKEEDQMVAHLLAKAASSVGGNREGTKHHGDTIDVSRRVARMIKYSPTYHLTFSLFTASSAPSSWDISAAISTYLQPVLDALSSISNFTIDSQVQFYAGYSPTIIPQFNWDSYTWTLTRDDLSNFINSAEWPLTSIKNYPTINFIVYVPPPEMSPLIVPDAVDGVNAWLLPQWGGVMIWNPPASKLPLSKNTIPTPEGSSEDEAAVEDKPKTAPRGPDPPTHFSLEDIKPSLDVFATQLLALLGAPSSLSSSTISTSLPIRIDSLTRQRAAESLLSASATLGSLARLVRALPSIAIPSTVAISVDKTLKALEKGCAELKEGRFRSALREGKVADGEAEKAFFERTMVAQVYFPEEHKVAVYLPLLGPVGVPLVMGALRVLRGVVEGWKASRKAR